MKKWHPKKIKRDKAGLLHSGKVLTDKNGLLYKPITGFFSLSDRTVSWRDDERVLVCLYLLWLSRSPGAGLFKKYKGKYSLRDSRNHNFLQESDSGGESMWGPALFCQSPRLLLQVSVLMLCELVWPERREPLWRFHEGGSKSGF